MKLPANKRKGFLQVNSITLGMFSQACPKYSKQVYNTFVISQGKCEGWTWYFSYRLVPKVSSNCYYHFRCVCPSMLKLPKITSLIFLCNILRKNWVMMLIFCMQVSMKACYKLIVWEWSKIPKVPNIASLQCLCSISKKKLKLKLVFCMQCFQVYSNTFTIKVSYKVVLSLSMGMVKFFQITQSNKFAISLQYLKKENKFAISLQSLKKEVRNWDHFWHADKHQSFYK